jgi:hypothetical protein
LFFFLLKSQIRAFWGAKEWLWLDNFSQENIMDYPEEKQPIGP